MAHQRDDRSIPILLAVLGLLAVCLGVTVGRMVRGPHSELDRELAAIKAAGEPVELTTLIPPPVPNRENAAVVYQRAFGVMYKGTEEEKQARAFFNSSNPSWAASVDRALVRRVAARNQPTLALLRQASTLPKCQFSVDWSDPVKALSLPYDAKLIEGMRLLITDAMLRNEDEDVEGAIQSCLVVLRMAKQIRKEKPAHLVSYSTAASFTRKALKVVQHVLMDKPAKTETYCALLKELDSVDMKADFTRALEGERCIGCAVCKSVHKGQYDLEDLIHPDLFIGEPPKPDLGDRVHPITLMIRILWPRDMTFYLRRMAPAISMSKLSRYDWKAISELDAWRRATGRTYTLLGGILLPHFNQEFRLSAATEARVQTTRLAVALRLFWHNHHSYPSPLTALTPSYLSSLPLDPFAAKPYLYHRRGKGFVVYSVGVNRKDDGGVENPKNWEEGDIVWRSEL